MSARPVMWTVVRTFKHCVVLSVMNVAGRIEGVFYGEQHAERAQRMADELNGGAAP